MKKLLLICFILFTYTNTYAQGLKSNGDYIKKNFTTEYENTIKKHALEKWNQDYEMVVYMINNQADALVDLVKSFESDNTNIVFQAIQKWSIKGYESSNISLFKELTTFSVKELIKLHCDWEMVKYEYDNQVKAKNSF